MNERRTRAPALGTRATARWAWRQLTSMRSALMLLLLLALAAVPGSLVPQRGADSQAYQAFRARQPDLSVWFDRLGLFSVYTSPWFSAIYVLLMISLVGCIVPRVVVYARAWGRPPPRAPRHLSRLPHSRTATTTDGPDVVLARARTLLARRGARVVGTDDEVRCETGRIRELGNLVFHISVVVVLVGVAAGGLWGYRGFVIVTEGSSFSNSRTQYDEITGGALFTDDDLPPFTLDLDQVDTRFELEGPQRGAPRFFRASGTYRPTPTAGLRAFDIRVNRPLTIDGSSVFLVGQGYAPVVRVTDARGAVAFEGPVPFLPQDATYTSTGVVKAPDAAPDQLGFQGFFLPTAVRLGNQAPVSAFPAAANPSIGLFAYYGDLGLDAGLPQSVYTLDRSRLTQVTDGRGRPFRIDLTLGQEVVLPEGRGRIEFVDLAQFARFRVTSQPGMLVPLWAGSIGLAGLMVSLYVRPRRVWVRARKVGDETLVEVAVLSRTGGSDPTAWLDDLVGGVLDRSSAQGRRDLADAP